MREKGVNDGRRGGRVGVRRLVELLREGGGVATDTLRGDRLIFLDGLWSTAAGEG